MSLFHFIIDGKCTMNILHIPDSHINSILKPQSCKELGHSTTINTMQGCYPCSSLVIRYIINMLMIILIAVFVINSIILDSFFLLIIYLLWLLQKLSGNSISKSLVPFPYM